MSKIKSIAPHWNGHLLCAIDTETTGLDCNYHEVCQICFLPLDADYAPNKDIEPFVALVKPEHPRRWDPGAAKVNGLMEKSRQHGIAPEMAYSLFVDWFYSIGLPPTDKSPFTKQIIPLAKNWAFDMGFLAAWMGYSEDHKQVIQQFVNGRYARDLQTAAHLYNDLAFFKGKDFLFPRTGLSSLCTRLGIEHPNAHDALGDCEATAACYRKLLQLRLPCGLDLG